MNTLQRLNRAVTSRARTLIQGSGMLAAAFWLLGGAVAFGAGSSWYVAPNGDDASPGSLEKPFATVQRAQQAAGPGDTVFLRGGTYRMKESQIAGSRGIFARIMVLNK